MKIRLLKKEYLLPSWCKIIFTLLPFLAMIALGFFISATNRKGDFDKHTEADAYLSQEPLIITTSCPTENSLPQTVSIYIIGEVLSPDVYQLPINSLVKDAVTAAGGATDQADLEAVNLAYPLNNNMMIKIPSIADTDKSWIVYEGLLNSFEQNPENDQQGDTPTGKININTASLSQLCNIPGIGENTAKKIIDYREQNGFFENIYDITKVSGIKDAKYEQIKDYITV